MHKKRAGRKPATRLLVQFRVMFTRPPAFDYKDGELHCDRVPLSRLAAKYGTPLYVYSASAIRERYRILDEAFQSVEHTICYSVKANSNLSILRRLARLGAGFDIVSGGELERVRLAKKKALWKTVFSGVGKTEEELLEAVRRGILLFNVESEGELELLAVCAARLRKHINVALRVNPDVAAATHPHISTGSREHKFGVPIGNAKVLYRQAARHEYLEVAGVSLHIGSQIIDVAPFRLAMERVVGLTGQLVEDGHNIRFVDAGGGLGISYSSAEPLDFSDHAKRYAEAILGPWQALKEPRPLLLLEPGRSIIAPAGVLLTRVLYQKENGSRRFSIVDAAMNDLIRPALYSARHEIVPVSIKRPAWESMPWDVVGPVCETGDFLARDADLPGALVRDYLCIFDAGAYGMSLASNYNTRPRAAEVLVDGRKARLVRRREQVKDVLRPEIACL
jgi:diaminopimelate decarboxylase